MKIEFAIPDFVPPERIIHILAGMEQIGYIEPHTRKVHMKISRCSGCGECCKKLNCPFLTERKTCGLNLEMPYICCTTEGKMETCTSRYEE